VNVTEYECLKSELERELIERFGPMIMGKDLATWLGYPSMPAFRQALSRKIVPVATFRIENRKGYFAMVTDVAVWLANQRYPQEMGSTKNET